MTVFSAFFGWAAPNLVCIRASVVLAKSQICSAIMRTSQALHWATLFSLVMISAQCSESSLYLFVYLLVRGVRCVSLLFELVMSMYSFLFGCAQISRTWTHNGATVLFFLFGLKSLWDGITHEGG
jgi:hypothetical protein